MAQAIPDVTDEKMRGVQRREQREVRREVGVERPRTGKKDDNMIYVGKKPTMSYVLAVITQFSDGRNEVRVKARGRSISRAVDVVEVVKNKFLPDVKRDIGIATEVIIDKENKKLNVSTIDIKITK